MHLSIATVCLSGTLSEKLEAIAAAGFETVEVFENDLLSFPGAIPDLKRLADDLGLRIAVFQPFRDFEGMPAHRRDKTFDRAERKFDVMAALGCDLLMVCSNVAPDSLGGVDRAAADLRELAERASRRGMRVGYEALSWGRHVNDYRDSWEIVRRADHPALGLVLDSFHILARGTDLATLRTIPGERICLVQMADAPRLQMDYLSWGRHYRCFPGQGELPIADFMDALAATRFNGIFSLEIFNDRFRAGSARGIAVDGMRSLLFTLDELRKRGADPLGSTAALPERALCQGLEFIEFALDDGTRSTFEVLLRGLGFHEAGRHRSKKVGHWTEGDINIVLNSERVGFAHSFRITHGPGVCAVALRVGDAAATVERAVALQDEPFRQPVGPGELDIPAVRGLGGSLVYFVDHKGQLDRLWDVDFLPANETPQAGIGLTAIDHVAQSMRYEEMLSWILFYGSLLDVEATSAQAVLDPGGIVQSQVVQTADGSLRLALNGSQSSRTLSSRFISEAFGAGVQHIAFSTRDIIASVGSLVEAGIRLLPIPAYYYEDLASRTDLSEKMIQTLKRLNILYDRDEDGEFFQAYTTVLTEGGFFFELVERRGYRGFGAVNAPVRLAAQTRLVPSAAMPRT